MQKLFENWRKLLEGDVIPFPGNEYERIRRETGVRLPLKPGGPAYKGEKEKVEVLAPADRANEIQASILKHMNDEYGQDWDETQNDAFWQLDDLLNALFPSGE
tara:strand:+ start:17 stop:325 length:309 start_codon:yes stop_codon:yes gene_type:complete